MAAATRFNRRLLLVAVACLFTLIPFTAFTQTVTGTLQGTVTDKSGGALPGVTLTVHNNQTGLERIVLTNGAGFYNMPFLPIGKYRVSADLAGFGKAVRDNVDVALNTTTVKDFVLDPAMSQTVVVTAEAPHIDTTDAEIKQTLTSEQIMAKPNASQTDFLTLAQTFSGFQENPTSGQNNPTLSSGSSINFNGTGTRGATFQVDGVNNDDSSENQNRQGVTFATIKAFQVIKNNFSAEFGRGYGAVVLVQTKSGANDIDGEAYAYRQDNKWNALPFFSRGTVRAKNHRDEYGLTVGFPILHDNLFAFLAGGKKNFAGQQNYARDIFLPSEFNQGITTPANNTPENRAFIQSVLARFPKVAPNDSRSIRAYAALQQVTQPADDYSSRVDWIPSTSDTLTMRYQRSHQIFGSTDIIIGEQARQNNRQSNFGTTYTRLFSSSTIGEFRYGLGLRSTNVNIAAGNDTPIIRFTGSPFSGSIIGNAGAFPINRNQRDNQIVYNLQSVLWSKHTLKVGTDLRRSSLNDKADNFSRGFYTFNTVCNNVTYSSAYAAFLDGCVRTFQKGYGPFDLQNRLQEANVYAEDEYRVTRNLNLDLGARFEQVSAPKEMENRLNYGFASSHYVDPRLGFAYTPELSSRYLHWLTGDPGRSSIRGGFGIFHGRVFQSVFSQSGANLRFNPPNAALVSFTNSNNLADPTNGFVFTPGQLTTRVALTKVAPDLKMPETRQWNLTYERQIFNQQKLRISYTGNLGKNLIQYDLNNLPVSPLAGGIVVPNHPFNAPAAGAPDLRGVLINKIAADFRCAGTGFIPGVAVNATCPTPVPIANNEISLRVPRTNERRPDPLYGTNLVVSNKNQSWYNGVEFAWDTGIVHGLQAQTNYTFSKALDTGSEATAVGTGDTNIFGETKAFARALSRFDTRHRFTFTGSWFIPFFKNHQGFLGAVLGGWQMSTFTKMSSGTPFTVTDSSAVDIDFNGFLESRPVLVDPSVVGRHFSNPNVYLNVPRTAFRSATPGDSISDLVGRNNFFLDGVRNVDAGLYKHFPAPGGQFELRLEAYNVFNHVQWGFPVTDIQNANFGKLLTQLNSPRILQVGVRYIY